jgi:hypothetical protein
VVEAGRFTFAMTMRKPWVSREIREARIENKKFKFRWRIHHVVVAGNGK